jgi:hypothetical protein
MNPAAVLHLGQARLAEMHRQARRNALASAARGCLTAVARSARHQPHNQPMT